MSWDFVTTRKNLSPELFFKIQQKSPWITTGAAWKEGKQSIKFEIYCKIANRSAQWHEDKECGSRYLPVDTTLLTLFPLLQLQQVLRHHPHTLVSVSVSISSMPTGCGKKKRPQEDTEPWPAHWNEDYDKDGDGVLFCDPQTLVQFSAIWIISSPCLYFF